MTSHFRLACGLIAASLALGGCASAANAEQDLTAHATLDYTNTQVILPVSEYEISNKDWRLITRARERVFSACMRKLGVDDSADVAAIDAAPVNQDRLFGVWNVEDAKKYGFSEGPNVPSTEATEDARSTAAADKCGSSQSTV